MIRINQTYLLQMIQIRKLVMQIKKIPDTSGLVKKIDFSSKITEIEGKIPKISGLATNSALTAVGNKIPNVSGLVKKNRL